MGPKGAELNQAATTQAPTNEAAALVDDPLPMGLPLGDLQARKMFGGYGVFANGVMLALVDPDGVAHLRAGPDTQPRFEAAGSVKHGRMPRWSIPAGIRNDSDALAQRATESLNLARSLKK